MCVTCLFGVHDISLLSTKTCRSGQVRCHVSIDSGQTCWLGILMMSAMAGAHRSCSNSLIRGKLDRMEVCNRSRRTRRAIWCQRHCVLFIGASSAASPSDGVQRWSMREWYRPKWKQQRTWGEPETHHEAIELDGEVAEARTQWQA
jgi:hypothetical protein